VGPPLELFVFRGLLDAANLSHRAGRTPGRPAEAEDTEGPDLEPGGAGILHFRGRPDLPMESRIEAGPERGLPTDCKGPGQRQQVTGKNEGRPHDMAIRLGARFADKPSQS